MMTCTYHSMIMYLPQYDDVYLPQYDDVYLPQYDDVPTTV